MNKRLNVKKTFIFFLILFIFVNILFLMLWYNFGVKTSIQDGYNELQGELHNDIFDSIEKRIKDNDEVDINSLFYEIGHKYNLLLIVRDSEHNIIFTNIDNISDREYLTPFVVNINNESYLVSVGKKNTINTVSITKKFMFFEIIFIITVLLVGLMIANKILLEPINLTIKDINNYKFGIKPKKRRVTNEIYYLQNEFVDLTTSLEKEHNEQNRIISAISHDIKTPLTSVIGYSDLLANKKLKKEERDELIKKIQRKSKDMKDIVSDFDDYLLSHKNRTYTFEGIDIKSLLDNIKFEYYDDLKEKNIKLDIYNKAKTRYIYIDIGKINRIFSNLIVNSIRHIEGKGRIIIECRDDKEKVYFKVIDNGIGVPEENLKKIFDPLFTTDKSRKISGLGLSITKEIVEMHGGEIKAYNNKDKGLTIEFSLDKNIIKEEQ